MEPTSPVSPALAGRLFTTEPPGKPMLNSYQGGKKMWFRDFPGGSVAKTALSKPGVQVRSLVRELDLTYCN